MINKIKVLLKDKKGKAVNNAIKNNIEIYNFLNNLIINNPAWGSISDAAYFITHFESLELPKCKVCGNSIKAFTLRSHPGANFCSLSCSRSKKGSSLTQEKIDNTFKTKYGVKSIGNLEWVKEKKKATCNKHYGTDYYAQCEAGKKACGFGLKKTEEQIKHLYEKGYELALKRAESENIELLIDKDEWNGIANGTKYKVKCKTCGNIFESYLNYSQPCICRTCYPKKNGSSLAEQEIAEYFSDLNYLQNNRDILGFEADIIFPDKKIAIEFDGLYWHSDKFRDNPKYHLDKTLKAAERGYKLVHIFEDEWIYKKDIVLSRLKAILGVSENRIYARKCEVRAVAFADSIEFQNSNHIQGYVPASIHYGLYYEDRLVSLMTFVKPRFNKKYNWELARFCSLKNYSIIGGASKLFKYFLKNNKGSIISYADRRWSNGEIYEKLGFRELESSNPAYWYVKDTKRYNRVKFQKHKLKTILEIFDENLSESENMIMNGYRKIYDCGNKVYLYDNTEQN